YVQFTAGVHIGGAILPILEVQDRTDADPSAVVAIAVAQSRDFATEVAAAYAAGQLGRRVTGREIPFLSAVIPGLMQVEAYSWLMFSHASAAPIRHRFIRGMLTKNMLPAALRNPFYLLRESLNAHVKAFLANNEQFIFERFSHNLSVAVGNYQGRTGIPTNLNNVMNELTQPNGPSLREYLYSMIKGSPKVGQYETVGLVSYHQLDDRNNQLPLALIELRRLAQDMDEATFDKTSREIADLANAAHVMAHRFVGWDDSRTRTRADRVSSSGLVREMQEIFDTLTRLRFPNETSRQWEKVLTRVERFSVSHAIASSVASGDPQSRQILQKLSTFSTRLQAALNASSQIPSNIRGQYIQAAHRLNAVLDGTPGARALGAHQSRSVPGQSGVYSGPAYSTRVGIAITQNKATNELSRQLLQKYQQHRLAPGTEAYHRVTDILQSHTRSNNQDTESKNSPSPILKPADGDSLVERVAAGEVPSPGQRPTGESEMAQHPRMGMSPVQWEEGTRRFVLDPSILSSSPAGFDQQVQETAALFRATARQNSESKIAAGLTSAIPGQLAADIQRALQFFSKITNSRLDDQIRPLTIVLTLANGSTINVCSSDS
ncbi:hypothetical protein, partial [Streptomyces sp. PA03-2a]|uniref:hypothetical protein n=1 Tax=Streptomyces sp. PA03-2a TaxID=3028701 RepID=UPI0029B6C871